MSALNWTSIGFTKNPFNIIPDIDQDTIIWAGFHRNKERFDRIITTCLTTNESNLILNLSRWGGGKTHTSVYYSKAQNLPKIQESFTPPVNIIVITPKEGNYGAYEFYTKIIENITMGRITQLVKQMRLHEGDEQSLTLLKQWSSSEDIGKVFWLLGESNEDIVFGAEQLIFGSGTATLRNKLRIRRNIESISDKFQVLSLIVRILSQYNDDGFLPRPRRVFLWIDELESLIYYTSKQFRPFTQAIRSLIDSTPSNLSIIMNFSFSEPSEIQNIEFVIGSALLDRITEKVVFDEANTDEALRYISELFAHFRVDNFSNNQYFPFNENSLLQIFDLAPRQTGLPLMPRTINKWCLYTIKAANNNGMLDEMGSEIEPGFILTLDYKAAID